MRPMTTLCQAAAMDAVIFCSLASTTPPCDEIADTDVGDYLLCAGCADALKALMDFAGLCARIKSARETRDATVGSDA